jgi:alcohol dehydrogenase (cytochrome c)
MKRSVKIGGIVFLVLLLGAAGLVAAVPDLRWRAAVVGMKLSGRLPDLPASNLVGWLSPSSSVYLGNLPTASRIDAGILNLHVDDATFAKNGEATFGRVCAACHGGNALGGTGPNLVAFISRSTDWQFFSTAKWGRKGSAMAAQPLSDQQIWEVHSYLRHQARAWSREASTRPTGMPNVDVPYSRIASAPDHADEWLTFTGDLSGHRHSALNQINRGNVKNLHVAWAAQLRPATKPLAATPIVANGVMYVSEAPDGVVALDARDGHLLWRFERPVDPSKLPVCCGAFNRGVAILGKRVFVATLDSYLVALDGATGKKVWEVEVADEKLGYTMTSAPMALDGKIVVGVAGGETGIRGLLAAYSPDDGKLIWRFYTVPGPGEPGHETWEGDMWKTGGASTWSFGTYDPKLDLLFWSTGNPWPPFDNSVRRGDNLYSNSIIALDPNTGKLKWHYQLTPADGNDWDATQQTILADIQWKGETVPAVLMASRNAFYYAIDRRNGKFLYAVPFVKQTWNRGFDANGRPDRDPASLPSPKGTLAYPWLHGGTNWWPPTYDPKRKLHYIPTVDAATLYFTIDEKLKPGTMTMRGTTHLASNLPAIMQVKAIDPDTGAIRWATRLDEGDFIQFARVTGLLSTDGDIIVGGLMDRVSIMDSDNGSILWQFRPGALVNAAPSTYSVDGVQYIALLAGNVLFSFALPPEARATGAAAR